MGKVIINSNKERYSITLLGFLEDNNYYELPNYPFKHSFDEMIFIEDSKNEVDDYAYYCLTNLSEVIEINKKTI